jgi:ribosomal protein S18 acetylase RimI-like enzyme
VSDICVAEGHRRRGVGRRLLAAFEAAMRGRGCRQLRICSKATNHAALAAYAAAGFQPYEVILWKALAGS